MIGLMEVMTLHFKKHSPKLQLILDIAVVVMLCVNFSSCNSIKKQLSETQEHIKTININDISAGVAEVINKPTNNSEVEEKEEKETNKIKAPDEDEVTIEQTDDTVAVTIMPEPEKVDENSDKDYIYLELNGAKYAFFIPKAED